MAIVDECIETDADYIAEWWKDWVDDVHDVHGYGYAYHWLQYLEPVKDWLGGE